VVAERLRDPKTLAGLGIVLLIVLWLLRRRG
jgi:hypothetical protein